jgi:hypothetical protein
MGEWLVARPDCIYPGKAPRYPFCWWLGGPQARLEAEDRGKILRLRRGSNSGRPSL